MSESCNYLISLTGTNPTPCFLTMMKNCNDDSKIYLVCTETSKNNIGTIKIAENLSNIIRSKYENIEINFVECDKSNTEKIEKTIYRIIGEIKKDISKTPYIKSKVVLDYSSGTKVMSALFYDRFKQIKESNIDMHFSYVDDISEKIIDKVPFDIKEIVRENSLSIEDFINIHGYRLKNKGKCKVMKNYTLNGNEMYQIQNEDSVIFQNNKGNEISVDSVFMLNGKLYFYIVSNYLKSKVDKEKLKMELFLIKDKIEKLAGNKSGIIYKCECGEKTRTELKKDLARAYEFEMEKRLSILGSGESLEDKIKDFYEFN